MSFLTLADGTRLRMSDRGDGPPVVLVHGWKGSHRLWDLVVVGLVERGHRVVSFDLRGMGESDKPRSAYDFDVFADDLAEVLKRHDLQDVTLVGWSMGCTVALRHLERGARRVARVALVNGPVRLTRADDFPHAMSAEQLEESIAGMLAGWPESERRFQAASLGSNDPTLADLLYRVALQTPIDVALSAVRAQARLDMRAAVRAAPVPVLAVYSRQDPYYPESLATWIAGAAPDGRAAIVERGGHATPLEDPAALVDAVSSFALERSSRE